MNLTLFQACFEQAKAIVLAHSVAGIELQACCSTSTPKAPDVGATTSEGIYAQLSALPAYYQLAASSQLGGSGSFQVPQYDKKGNITGYKTQSYNLPSAAETNKTLADYYTQAALDLGNKYGSQNVELQRKLLQESDPTGFAAREQLGNQVMADLNGQKSDRPIAGELEKQIMADLQAGGNMDEQTLRQFQQAARGAQSARGNILGNAAAFDEAAQVGTAAEQRRQQHQANALSFLSSGQSNDDKTYGRKQQALSNLGAFLSGQAPQGQFNSVNPGQINPGYNPGNPNINTGLGASYAASVYGPQVSGNAQQDAQRMNAWKEGIGAAGTLIGGIASAF